MTNSNLTRYDNNGIELIIDTTTGESFATQRGYARMSGKTQSTINSRINRMTEGERNQYIKTAEADTQGGLQGVRLIPEDLITEWIVKDNPEMAKQLMKLGVRVFLHQLAGFNVKSDAIAYQPIPQLTRSLPNSVESMEVLKYLDTMPDDRVKRLLRNKLEHELSLASVNQKHLTGSDTVVEEYTTATVRAHYLGYSSARIGNGIKLGNFVKKLVKPAFQDLQGQYYVWHYQITPDFDNAIHKFFALQSVI